MEEVISIKKEGKTIVKGQEKKDFLASMNIMIEENCDKQAKIFEFVKDDTKTGTIIGLEIGFNFRIYCQQPNNRKELYKLFLLINNEQINYGYRWRITYLPDVKITFGFLFNEASEYEYFHYALLTFEDLEKIFFPNK